MSLPLKIKGKRVAKARNIELLEVPFKIRASGMQLPVFIKIGIS